MTGGGGDDDGDSFAHGGLPCGGEDTGHGLPLIVSDLCSVCVRHYVTCTSVVVWVPPPTPPPQSFFLKDSNTDASARLDHASGSVAGS